MEILVGNPPILINVFIPMGAKKIAVLLSGGSDSAILLYILAKECKKYNVDLMIFTVPRADGAINYSPKIVFEINKLLDIDLAPPIAVGDPHNHHHSQQTRSGHREILAKYPDVDYIYYGSQKVATELENLENVIYPWRPDRLFYQGKTVCPFFDLTKDHTLDLYYQLGVEDLLKYSHSCCVWDKGRCGKCYNCIERNWAFQKLDKTDPGCL
jgi:7-cyano-7-deazaguanine synthase in queuosine biosynthesis